MPIDEGSSAVAAVGEEWIEEQRVARKALPVDPFRDSSTEVAHKLSNVHAFLARDSKQSALRERFAELGVTSSEPE